MGRGLSARVQGNAIAGKLAMAEPANIEIKPPIVFLRERYSFSFD